MIGPYDDDVDVEHGASRWAAITDGSRGSGYAAQFARLAAAGMDVHGEATLCASLVPPGSRILDAGCGTGRVAIRLAEQGHSCTGIDNDASMLTEAQAAGPDVTWLLADLVDMNTLADLAEFFDLVVAAGNVVPLLAPGTEALVVAAIAQRLVPGGLLVAGFGLDRDHLPLPAAPFGLADYDRWCAMAGLTLDQRYATWDGDVYDGGGYAVSVHRAGPVVH